MSNFFLPCTGASGMMGYGFGGGMFGGIIMIIWWAVIIVAVVAVIKWVVGQAQRQQGGGKAPIDIVKERYAKGEINKEEFEARKKDLQ